MLTFILLGSFLSFEPGAQSLTTLFVAVTLSLAGVIFNLHTLLLDPAPLALFSICFETTI